MGAIATGGVMVLDEEMVRRAGVTGPELRAVADAERRELARREQRYRGDRPPPEIAGRTVILVDDGLATGSTMRAAVSAVRREGARRVVVAVPIAPPETCDALRAEADDAVCAVTPEPFVAVGMWYDDFSQTTDAEVQELLDDARASATSTPPRIPLPMDPLDATAEWGTP